MKKEQAMKVIKKYIQDMAILYQGLRYLDVNIYTP
jgi:glutamine cyclotransferase